MAASSSHDMATAHPTVLAPRTAQPAATERVRLPRLRATTAATALIGLIGCVVLLGWLFGVGTWLFAISLVVVLLPLTWVLALSLDHTESERKRVLSAELDQARRLDGADVLAGGIAHDCNNLLGIIINYANFVADALPEQGQTREDIEEIRDAAQRAASLTRQLLTIGRGPIAESEVLDLNEVVEGFGNLLRDTLGERTPLETRLGDDLWPVDAEPGQLERVLLNLAVNARDAMPDGGRLTVETANVLLDQSFAAGHVDVPPGRYVRLTVSDCGTGMDQEVRRRAFEPFFTTKPKGQGTGLGLATVDGIVARAGGWIDLDSERGTGTTIRVHLPADVDAER
ncbi:MAG TPA: ATP-binding protein [Solirubrobacteraceae bacterium]|nr:ATP-binding protein [Solirubrobacteraceae bacterium]